MGNFFKILLIGAISTFLMVYAIMPLSLRITGDLLFAKAIAWLSFILLVGEFSVLLCKKKGKKKEDCEGEGKKNP